MVNDGENDYLKQWIKYRAGDYPDADEVLKINDDEGCILEKLDWFNSGVKKKEQYIDCIFSMSTFFKAFLKFYAAGYEYYAQLLENYDIIFCENYRKLFCHNYDPERDFSEDDIKKLFEQINLFARNTHTIGNYMPCPDGRYNGLKGNYQCFKDRLELFYLALQKPECPKHMSGRKDELRDWFAKNKQKLLLEEILETRNEELLEFQFNGYKMNKKDIIPYTKYLECVNEVIIERGKELAKKLRK